MSNPVILLGSPPLRDSNSQNTSTTDTARHLPALGWTPNTSTPPLVFNRALTYFDTTWKEDSAPTSLYGVYEIQEEVCRDAYSEGMGCLFQT